MSDKITTREAADILGIRPYTVENLLRKGRLPGSKRGSVWTVSRRSMRRYKTNTSVHGLTVKKASEILNVAKKSIMEAIRHGKLNGKKIYNGKWDISGRWIIDPESLQNYKPRALLPYLESGYVTQERTGLGEDKLRRLYKEGRVDLVRCPEGLGVTKSSFDAYINEETNRRNHTSESATNPKVDFNDLITLEEASEILGCNPFVLISEEKLPKYRVGERILVRESRLHEYLQEVLEDYVRFDNGDIDHSHYITLYQYYLSAVPWVRESDIAELRGVTRQGINYNINNLHKRNIPLTSRKVGHILLVHLDSLQYLVRI